jgi:glutathione S-transferase
MPAIVTVHHLNNSRSQRVLWLLEELGVPYEVKHYQRDRRTMLAPPELLKVHPLGKSPVITDGEHTVAESGAILEYLVDRYGQGRFRPRAGSPQALRYTYWMHFAEGTAMSPLLMKLVFDTIERQAPLLVRPIAAGIARQVKARVVQPNIDRQLAYMEAELGKSTWFAGDELTAADVQMSFPVLAAHARGGLDGRYPRLQAFLQRIQARPAYRKAIEQGGPFTLS